MKVYDLKDVEGKVFAFEVDCVGRRAVCRIAQRIPGARILKRPRWLSWFREQEFCEFELDGVNFLIAEPFGDNSRYWVGPRPRSWHPQIETVREAFLSA